MSLGTAWLRDEQQSKSVGFLASALSKRPRSAAPIRPLENGERPN
jgi:hypothetical protein